MKKVFLKTLICLVFILNTIYVNAADPKRGSEMYATNCQICHADDGRGVVPDAPNFRFGDNLIKPDRELFDAISSGKGMMPGFRGILSEQDILNVISHLRTLHR